MSIKNKLSELFEIKHADFECNIYLSTILTCLLEDMSHLNETYPDKIKLNPSTFPIVHDLIQKSLNCILDDECPIQFKWMQNEEFCKQIELKHDTLRRLNVKFSKNTTDDSIQIHLFLRSYWE